MSTLSPAVACHGITKSFDRTPALADINFAVAPGEKVALLGASGAGKSTLLNILAGLVAADSGSLQLLGQDPTRLRRKERAQLVGIIQQRLNLVGPLRAQHNIQAGLLGHWGFIASLAALTLPMEVPAARTIAEEIGLSEKLSQRTFTLSGGEQQRVAAARVFLQNPAILLADEPVASLDINTAEVVLGMLTREENQTVLMSLHNPAHALAYATRIIGLREGKLAFDLPSDEVTQLLLEQLYDSAPHL